MDIIYINLLYFIDFCRLMGDTSLWRFEAPGIVG